MMRFKDNSKNNKLSGRYEILELIGVGGMSYVYKAYDTKKKRVVAIKVLKEELSIDDEFVTKFKSEALACKDIRQENVVCAYDVVDEGDMHYIVLEYVDGITLNKYIEERGHLSNDETIDVSLQVARGIAAAHKNGIIHRDIKPQNIVITGNGVAKITDFGIARAITSTTKNISVVGTVHYISPEQVRNVKVDYRSDIYSFGCTMYEMITGKVPFEGETPVEIVVSHLRQNLDKPSKICPDIYKSLEKIILKATRMTPRERYQTIEEMIVDLEKAKSDKEGSYIKDSVYDDDDEGKTVIISDEDMKLIQIVSARYTKENTYMAVDSKLTNEQKRALDRYIEDNKKKLMSRRVIIAAIIAIVFLIVFMILIALDTRKPIDKKELAVSSDSIATNDIIKSLEGLNIELAENLVKEYGIKLKVVGDEFSDILEHGKIIKIVKDNYEKDGSIELIVSKGSETLDFSDTKALNDTKWDDMKVLLDERKLDYKIREEFSNDIPRGYIIRINKKNSLEDGDLIVTISKGLDASVRLMPNLVNKPISEAREILEANELLLGNISFIRDAIIPENYVIAQSVAIDKEVQSGTTVDLFLSCGPDGVEYIPESAIKWHGVLSTSYSIVTNNEPGTKSNEDTKILQVRLMQVTENGVIYTELVEPREYKIDATIPLIFKDIEGEPNVATGVVQVVDVENDTVLFEKEITFKPN